MLGTLQTPFAGIFDGNGKTMTLVLKLNGESLVAPFRYISGATIRNLRTAGGEEDDPGVQSGDWASGLVGKVLGGPNMIENCEVAAAVGSVQGNIGITHAVGFVVHGGSARTTISNCVFSGVLSIFTSINELGGFWGVRSTNPAFWGGADMGAVPILEHCLILADARVWQGDVEPAMLKGVYYYTDSYQYNTDAKQLFAITAGENVNISIIGELGFTYQDMLFAAADETVELALSSPTLEPGTEVFTVETTQANMAHHFTLTRNGDIWTLTMPSELDSMMAGTITIAVKELNYSITIDSGITNGWVGASKIVAHSGDKITLTVTPNENGLFQVRMAMGDGNFFAMR